MNTVDLKPATAVVRLALLNEIDTTLVECTPSQVSRFREMFPDLAKQTEGDLKNILSVCQRTVRKNRESAV